MSVMMKTKTTTVVVYFSSEEDKDNHRYPFAIYPNVFEVPIGILQDPELIAFEVPCFNGPIPPCPYGTKAKPLEVTPYHLKLDEYCKLLGLYLKDKTTGPDVYVLFNLRKELDAEYPEHAYLKSCDTEVSKYNLLNLIRSSS